MSLHTNPQSLHRYVDLELIPYIIVYELKQFLKNLPGFIYAEDETKA
ncbi:MAG: hypothetical protein ACXADU_04565 [Promethearchaeota archaeon]